VHNQELPEGWLGKCWALHRGSQLARGEWLLFCDGDVVMEKTALEQAIATAESEGLDHLCMAPRLVCSSWWQETVITSLTFLFFVFQDPRHVFDPRKLQAYMGVGAFNMIRRSLYEKLGGHETLRMEIVDDVFLGMLAKRHGGRSGFFLGLEQASIHWYPSLWDYITGLEKNSFAGLRFSVGLLAFAIVGQILVFHLPLMMVFFAEGWRMILWLSSVLLAHIYFAFICFRSQVSLDKAMGLTPAILIQFFAFVRSAAITLQQGGVRWRGSFYSLHQLRQAQRELRGPLGRWLGWP
jgi:cellulose synthase/poly-beta-1,6-N-acetylglucosamine synthase-like glycosyltransferase